MLLQCRRQIGPIAIARGAFADLQCVLIGAQRTRPYPQHLHSDDRHHTQHHTAEQQEHQHHSDIINQREVSDRRGCGFVPCGLLIDRIFVVDATADFVVCLFPTARQRRGGRRRRRMRGDMGQRVDGMRGLQRCRRGVGELRQQKRGGSGVRGGDGRQQRRRQRRGGRLGRGRRVGIVYGETVLIGNGHKYDNKSRP